MTHAAAAAATAAAAPGGFAARLRAASADAHAAAESSPFLGELLEGSLVPAAHAALLAQTHPLYAVLEEAATTQRHDPVAGAFVDDALVRLPSIEADLAHLLGPGWRSALVPSPAAARYAQRLREVAFDWPGGFVAHHYLRYLGDLSGGQAVRRLLQRAYGLGEDGVRSWSFPAVDSPKRYRDRYRALLDAAAWDEPERARVVAEVRRGYRLAQDLFDDLAAAAPGWRR